MTVTDVSKDAAAGTLTITATLAAPVERAWQLLADPRQLERWWGPPTYPATFVEHDLSPGGTVTYFMTGPEGDRSHGCWKVVAVDPPRRLEVEDSFADESGAPNPDMPTTSMVLTMADAGDGTTVLTLASRFPSAAVMEQMVAIGMEAGITLALGQIDALLAE